MSNNKKDPLGIVCMVLGCIMTFIITLYAFSVDEYSVVISALACIFYFFVGMPLGILIGVLLDMFLRKVIHYKWKYFFIAFAIFIVIMGFKLASY